MTMRVFPRPGQTRKQLARELLALNRAGGHRRDTVRVDPAGGFVVPDQVAQAWLRLHNPTPPPAPAPAPAPPPTASALSPAPDEQPAEEPDTGQPAQPTEATLDGTGRELPADPPPAEPEPSTPAPPVVTEKSAAAEVANGIGTQRSSVRRPRKRAQPTKKVT